MSVGFGPITTLPGPGQLQLPAPASSDCLQCASLRQLLTQCGACGPQQPGPGVCPCGGVYPNCIGGPPCPPGQCLNPQTGCCTGCQLTLCPAGEHAQPCLSGECVDPQSGCCEACTSITSCPCGGTPPNCRQCCCGGHPQPCSGTEILNQCGCCAPGPSTSCPPGDVAATQGICPPNYTPDPTAPGCCQPGQGIITRPGQCPSQDVPGTNGICPPNYSLDPAAPSGLTCCSPGQGIITRPTPCPPSDTAAINGTCPQGTYPDSANPGCCAPEAVEACFVCPKGLPELTAALQGQANTCYLASQMFLPPGSLPAAASP